MFNLSLTYEKIGLHQNTNVGKTLNRETAYTLHSHLCTANTEPSTNGWSDNLVSDQGLYQEMLGKIDSKA